MSTKPESFITTTDFATLKNDASGSFTLYIYEGSNINGFATKTFESFYDIGTVNAGIRAVMSTTKYAEHINGVSMTTKLRMYYSIDSGTYDFYVGVNIERVSPTRLRMYMSVYNPYDFAIQIQTGSDQTITADVSTFLSPFN